jgi:hypothetical protein
MYLRRSPAIIVHHQQKPVAVVVHMLPTMILPPGQTCYNGTITIIYFFRYTPLGGHARDVGRYAACCLATPGGHRTMRFVFGDFTLDTERYELRRAGQVVALTAGPPL